jgi:uncharacterized protein
MSLTLYDASVPVFTRYLKNLAKLLALAQAHAASEHLDPATLLDARLAPSMLPFAMQVEIATQFSLRACAPLAQQGVPAHGEHARSFEALAARIAAALNFLEAMTPAQMEGAAERVISSRAGEEVLSLPGREFLLQYALPNFFFHLTTAYAILRQQGLLIGKGDFDGFHVYAPGT